MSVCVHRPGKAPSSVREQYANAYTARRLRQNRFSSIRPKVKSCPLYVFVRRRRRYPLKITLFATCTENYQLSIVVFIVYNPGIVGRGRIGLFVFKQIDPSPFTTNVRMKSRRRDFRVLHTAVWFVRKTHTFRFYVGFSLRPVNHATLLSIREPFHENVVFSSS